MKNGRVLYGAEECGVADVRADGAEHGGRSKRNKTLRIEEQERAELAERLLRCEGRVWSEEDVENRTICGDIDEVLELLPEGFADLVVVDPPYNLSKNFNGWRFSARNETDYYDYLNSWFGRVCRVLKPDGTLYMCGDWRCTAVLQRVMSEHLCVMNRITWQREKGRGAKANWKNSMEDIWFGVKNSENYYFNLDAVKQKRRVVAPYRSDGRPRDWQQTEGGKFRLTCPANFWDDISVPYWSMPENTDHPTQKPEKLMAKLILASCPEGGMVFDPFLGSGTTSVTAKKLGRRYCGVEINEEYAMLAEKRLGMADCDNSIQGYRGGVFWERNTLAQQLAEEREKRRKKL